MVIGFLLRSFKSGFDLLGDDADGEESNPGEPSAEAEAAGQGGGHPIRALR
ncbi:hypothetical protein DsansV1_C06g0064881 [Dioscorea sansibarensis]